MSKLSPHVLRAFAVVVALGIGASAMAQDGSTIAFAPSTLAVAITGLFAVATLVTGAAALLGNTGASLLIRTEDFVVVGSDERVSAPNVRAWGARQVVTGATLWGALFLGDQVLFQVGLAGLLLRQGLDIVVYLLDGTPLRTVPFVVAAVPTIAAFLSVL